MLIAGFGRRGHAVGDIPGVRFKVGGCRQSAAVGRQQVALQAAAAEMTDSSEALLVGASVQHGSSGSMLTRSSSEGPKSVQLQLCDGYAACQPRLSAGMSVMAVQALLACREELLAVYKHAACACFVLRVCRRW